MARAGLLHVALLMGAVNAIYPEGHFDLVTKLSNDNFDATVQSAIDTDKTLFVRWIASEGCGCCRKQAPSWNQVVEMFKDNGDVVFADSALSDGGPRGGATASPGAGGWPTIRYYNKETGVDGANYEKKSDMSMCDELGPKGMSEGNNGYMVDYILEAGKTTLCSIDEPYNGCGEKEKGYIVKMSASAPAEIATKMARLEGMKGKSMKPELKQWLNQRSAILKQFSSKGKDEL